MEKLSLENSSEELAKDIHKLFTTSPLILTKKTKSGEKDIDIIPLINSVSAEYLKDTGNIAISATLSAGSDNFLNPEMLITAMRSELGILNGDPSNEWYSIMRTRSLKSDMTDFR